MLKFQNWPKIELVHVNYLIPETIFIAGLPTYAYDMHTRTGKIALGRLARSTCIQTWQQKNQNLETSRTFNSYWQFSQVSVFSFKNLGNFFLCLRHRSFAKKET